MGGQPILTLGTVLSCKPWGMVPMPMMVLPTNRILTGKMPTASMKDVVPFLNIPSFIMCTSKANPMVIAVMAASFGAVQQAPCIPAPVSPWIMAGMRVPGGKVPLITKSACTMCMWAGTIAPQAPAQFQASAAAP